MGSPRVLMLATVAVCLAAGCSRQADPQGRNGERLNQLTEYIHEHTMSPEEYVLSKFKDHDIVFLGEHHRFRHDVALVRDMIPRLYRRGIYNLGIEFANNHDQPDIDRLITAEKYDEALARQIQFNQWPFWGYQDYIDIYKAAWEFNYTLPDTARTFRVVGLNARMDWGRLWSESDRENPETMARAFPDGDGDRCMANVILREFVEKGEKALIYSGMYHAFTRFHQPVYDAKRDSVIRYNSTRMGNIVYDSIGDRAFLICLHYPWPSFESFGESVLAADGYIDRLIAELEKVHRRAGFDVVGTPFANLPCENCYWKHGYPDFRLADYCDGYIIQGPLKGYEGVKVAEGFINESNRLAAAVQSANLAAKDSSRTVEQLVNSIARDTEIQRIFEANVAGYGRLKP